MRPAMSETDGGVLSDANVIIDLSKRQGHDHAHLPPPASPSKRMVSSVYIRDGQDPNNPDDISSATIPESFEDDFSIASTQSGDDPQHLTNLSYSYLELDDTDLSMSSINTKALKQINELRKRLRIQENTKLELLNQCLDLEGRLERNDTRNAYVRIYKSENHKLRESTAKMERDFMNEMNQIVGKMHVMEEEYEDKIGERDDKIRRLEEELRLLRVAKNLDDVTTTTSVMTGLGSSSI